MNRALTLGALLGLVLLTVAPSNAHEIKAGQLVITHPWMRQPASGNAAYGCMKITNKGKTDERLIAATIAPFAGERLIPASTAGAGVPFEFSGNIVIPAGQTVRLNAESSQQLQIKLGSPLLEGSTLPGSLIFERAGVIEIEYEIGE